MENLNQDERKMLEKKSIHELFELQVVNTPNKPAVIYGDEKISYLELNQRANFEAKYLSSFAKPKVVIYMEPSINSVIAILAVLKVGGNFLLLNPEYPKLRIKAIIEDYKPNIIFKDQSTLKKDPLSLEGTFFFNLSTKRSEENPGNKITINDTAYVIYTSGSTGKPKGIPINHEGITKWKNVFATTLNMRSSDNVLQYPSDSFDASIWDKFRALLTGATLHLISDTTRKSIDRCIDYINTNKITTVTLTPSVLNVLVDKIEQIKSKLRIISTGEAFSGKIIDIFIKYGHQLFNGYGPSEVGIGATLTPVYKAPASIGRPIEGMTFYICDDKAKPYCKITNTHTEKLSEPQIQSLNYIAKGELYIAGAGLFSGYIDPIYTKNYTFARMPDEQLAYKTQDIVELHPDGDIYFKAREGRIIKLNGQLIDLNEIENSLINMPGISQAAVIKQDYNEKQEIVAYIVFDKEVIITPQNINKYLSDKIPLYMNPSIFVNLPTIPLTENQKIDYQVLISKNKDSIAKYILRPNIFVRYRNNIEKKLTEFCAKILNCDMSSISIDDRLDNLGMKSIDLMYFVNLINKEFSYIKTYNNNNSLFYENILVEEADMAQYRTIREVSIVIYARQNLNKINYIKQGNGALIVCVPDIMNSFSSYKNIIEYYNDKNHFVFIPLPDYNDPYAHMIYGNLRYAAIYQSTIIINILKNLNLSCIILGYSFGAVLATEIVALLEQKFNQSKPVDQLFLIDMAHPQAISSLDNSQCSQYLYDTGLNIRNYLIAKHESQPHDLQITVSELKNKKSPIDKINFLFEKMLMNLDSKLSNDLLAIKENLIAIYTYKEHKELLKHLYADIKNVHSKIKCNALLFYTEILKTIFNDDDFFGWKQCFKEPVNTNLVNNANHFSIMKDKLRDWIHIVDHVIKNIIKNKQYSSPSKKFQRVYSLPVNLNLSDRPETIHEEVLGNSIEKHRAASNAARTLFDQNYKEKEHMNADNLVDTMDDKLHSNVESNYSKGNNSNHSREFVFDSQDSSSSGNPYPILQFLRQKDKETTSAAEDIGLSETYDMSKSSLNKRI